MKTTYKQILTNIINLEIAKGKVVKVIKGKKVSKGVTGEVFWLKSQSYGVGWQRNDVVKIGIKDENGNVYWTYAHNVEVDNYKKYMPPVKKIIKEMKRKMSYCHQQKAVIW